MKESYGWKCCFVSSLMEAPVKHIAFLSKFPTQQSEKMLAVGLCSNLVHLWLLEERADAQLSRKIGAFDLRAPIDRLFFIGNQLVALSWAGKVGVWNSMTHTWQVQGGCLDLGLDSVPQT